VAISLNVDFNGDTGGPSEQLQSDVRATLARMNIACENVISSDSMDDVLKEFDIFSLPAALIYDAQGQLHQRFDGSVTYQQQVFPEVKRLLASG
jgi:hypothetical protein